MKGFLGIAVFAVAWGLASGPLPARAASKPEPLLFVVMDPLSKELACACVKGYAQRDYRKLAAQITELGHVFGSPLGKL